METLNIDMTKNIQILFVDDERIFLQVVKKLFTKMGYKNIFCAHSGKEALKVISEKKIDIVFLDLLLPDMKGEIIYDEINALNRNMPIVFMSGQIGLDIDSLQKERKAFAYIQKPFDIEAIKTILKNVSNVI